MAVLGVVLSFPTYGLFDAVFLGALLLTGAYIVWLHLFIIDYVSMRLVFMKYGTVDFSLEQYREVTLDMLPEEALPRVVNAIKAVKGAKNIKATEDGGTVTAITDPNLKTFGDAITVELSFMFGNKTLVLINSSPRLETSICDFGKNYENVEQIKAALLSA